jgi:NAD(P)-dependent dehydrogenase (short-subunit alcohol dehydrogenase family)
MSLVGQRVIIVGGSQGCGFAIAQKAAALGADVIILARDADRLLQAAQRIEGAVRTAVMDMTDEDAVRGVFAELDDIEHLVVVGSSVASKPVISADLSTVRSSMDTKFWGACNVVRHARLTKTASVTLFSGVLSRRPMAGQAFISSANAAVEALGRTLAIELAPVRVNVIAPGVIDTPIFSMMTVIDRNNFFNSLRSRIPAGRPGLATEVADLAIHLFMNRYVTGAVLDIDGGYSVV